MAEGEPKEIIDLYKQVLVSQAENRELDEEQPTVSDVTDTQDTACEGHWKDTLMLNPNVLEYGDKEAEIIDFAIIDDKNRITNNIQKNTDFRIRMKVKFHKDIEDPIFAFTIKDLQGTEVTGTNTMYEKTDIGLVKAGEEKVVEFSQNMNLQGRNYLLSFGCVGYHENDFVVYNRLYDVCNINVISDKNTVGFYDMNSTVRVLK